MLLRNYTVILCQNLPAGLVPFFKLALFPDDDRPAGWPHVKWDRLACGLRESQQLLQCGFATFQRGLRGAGRFSARQLFEPPFKLKCGLPGGKPGHVTCASPGFTTSHLGASGMCSARDFLVVLAQAAFQVHGGSHICGAFARRLQQIHEEFFCFIGFFFGCNDVFVVRVYGLHED